MTPFQPNSGVVVLPSSTAPASRSRAVAGASVRGRRRLRPCVRLPRRSRPAARQHQVLDRRRHAVDEPRIGSPRCQRSSEARAARQRARLVDQAERADRVVPAADPREAGFCDLDRRQGLATIELQQLGGAQRVAGSLDGMTLATCWLKALAASLGHGCRFDHAATGVNRAVTVIVL